MSTMLRAYGTMHVSHMPLLALKIDKRTKNFGFQRQLGTRVSQGTQAGIPFRKPLSCRRAERRAISVRIGL